MTIRLFNQDCMTAMREMPDEAYDLAIVDPPYGDGAGGQESTNSTTTSQSCFRRTVRSVLEERERERERREHRTRPDGQRETGLVGEVALTAMKFHVPAVRGPVSTGRASTIGISPRLPSIGRIFLG